VNGVIDGTDIIYRDYCDISIAVATPKGLVVPVLRDADKLDFAGVERVRLIKCMALSRCTGCVCYPEAPAATAARVGSCVACRSTQILARHG
jgi:2-oxoacid dehydrogenases acyltransferase (catalytic domain)